MSDEEFIKLAYKKGRVRDVAQAFVDFPPELEWHEGKVENILKDKKQNIVHIQLETSFL